MVKELLLLLLYPQVTSHVKKTDQKLKTFRSRFESRRWLRGRGRRGRIQWKEERERRKRFEECNDQRSRMERSVGRASQSKR